MPGPRLQRSICGPFASCQQDLSVMMHGRGKCVHAACIHPAAWLKTLGALIDGAKYITYES